MSRVTWRASCSDASVVLAGEGNTRTLSEFAAVGAGVASESVSETWNSVSEDSAGGIGGGASGGNGNSRCVVVPIGAAADWVAAPSDCANQSSGGNAIPQTLPGASS